MDCRMNERRNRVHVFVAVTSSAMIVNDDTEWMVCVCVVLCWVEQARGK